VLYLNEKGKKELVDDSDILKSLLEKGYSICAADLRGTGETAPDMSEKFWDFLAGKPLFGQRIMDIISIIKWLKNENSGECNIRIWGSGLCALYAAFAGVLVEDIAGLLLENPLISFGSLVTIDIPGYNHEILLPGILEKFDMQHIYQSLAPKPVMIINPLGGDKKNAVVEEIAQFDKTVAGSYSRLKSSEMWGIYCGIKEERAKVIIGSPVF
jgi:hypothetical protein